MRTLDRIEAADFLKCDRDTVSALVASGSLPSATIGKGMVFMEDDLIEYLRDQVRKQTDARRKEPVALKGRKRLVLNLP